MTDFAKRSFVVKLLPTDGHLPASGAAGHPFLPACVEACLCPFALVLQEPQSPAIHNVMCEDDFKSCSTGKGFSGGIAIEGLLYAPLRPLFETSEQAHHQRC